MAVTPVFLPGEFHGQRSLEGYSPWGCKESDTTEQLSTHAHCYMYLYKYMYIHEKILLCLSLKQT